MDSVLRFPSHYRITGYRPGETLGLEKFLSTFDRVRRRYDPLAVIYDKEKKELRLPGGVHPGYVAKATGHRITRVNKSDPYDFISIRSTAYPRNDLQKEMVQFLIGQGKYTENINHSQLACNAETGEGKTYAAISVMTYMRCKGIFIVNRKNIKTNWINEIIKFTDIDKERILDCDTDAIKKILNGKLNATKYRAFVAIHRSIYKVAQDLGWDAIQRFFVKIKVGLKVYDEANMEFTNSVYIDCYTNTLKTLYLTANMEKSGFRDNIVFTRAFATVPKFNQYELGYTDSKKHIVCIAIMYNSHPTIQQISACKVKRYGWFSPKEYSMYQIRNDSYFYDILYGTLDKFSVGKNLRTLVLVSRIEACDEIAKNISNQYKNKIIGIYHSGIGDKDKKNVLKISDIIVSTGQSLGFSETIANLRVVINCEAFRFKATGNQASGRLRRPADDSTCLYIELVDNGFRSISDMYNSRKPYYKKLFSAIYELNYEADGFKGF